MYFMYLRIKYVTNFIYFTKFSSVYKLRSDVEYLGHIERTWFEIVVTHTILKCSMERWTKVERKSLRSIRGMWLTDTRKGGNFWPKLFLNYCMQDQQEHFSHSTHTYTECSEGTLYGKIRFNEVREVLALFNLKKVFRQSFVPWHRPEKGVSPLRVEFWCAWKVSCLVGLLLLFLISVSVPCKGCCATKWVWGQQWGNTAGILTLEDCFGITCSNFRMNTLSLPEPY